MRRSGWIVALTLLAPLAQADVVLYSNGPIVNQPGGGAGGAHASRVQGELGLTVLGFGTVQTTASNPVWIELADDFTITTPGGWRVTSITLFSVPPTGIGTTPCLSAEVADAWVGVHAAPGGPIQAGGQLVAQPIGVWRVPTANPLYVGCPVSAVRVALNLTLAPGTYWVTWTISNSTGFGFNPAAVPVTRNGQAGGGNAQQRLWTCDFPTGMCTPGPWSLVADGVHGQDLAFEVRGTPESVVKGNLDRTQAADLVFRNEDIASTDFNRNKVWFMDGTARSGEAFVTPDPPGPNWVVVGSDDFDSWSGPGLGPDGQSDLVFYDTSTGQVAFWLMDGTTRAGAPVPLTGAAPLPLEWSLSATGDFNADGWPDLLWRNEVTLKLVVWTMKGTQRIGTLVPSPDQATHANWRTVAALDANGDGARDLLWYNRDTGKIVTWYLNAVLQRLSGQFTNPPSAGDANWKVVASGDYSWSYAGTPPLQAPDIVWRNATSGNQVVWHMDLAGNRVFGQFTSPTANTPASAWRIVGPR